MNSKEVLWRVEEIEASLGDGSTDDRQAPITTGEIRWLCQAIRQLSDQLKELQEELDTCWEAYKADMREQQRLAIEAVEAACDEARYWRERALEEGGD